MDFYCRISRLKKIPVYFKFFPKKTSVFTMKKVTKKLREKIAKIEVKMSNIKQKPSKKRGKSRL